MLIKDNKFQNRQHLFLLIEKHIIEYELLLRNALHMTQTFNILGKYQYK